MRLSTHRHLTRRSAFTLVEVLVACGLCILIMAVMATAFQAGLDTLSQLRSLAGLQQQLRSAEDVIRRDLRAEHLESPFGNRVSDQRLDLWQPPTPPLVNGIPQASLPPGSPEVWHPPTRGGFRLIQEGENTYTLPSSFQRQVSALPNLVTGLTNVVNSPSELEGYDPAISSSRATRHILQMAVKLPGDRLDHAFSSRVPLGALLTLSRFSGVALLDQNTLLQAAGAAATNATPVNLPTKWAEVTMFLDVSNPTGTTPTNLPYFTLYRRVRALEETDPAVPLSFTTFQSAFPGLSVAPGVAGKPVNSAGTWTNPANRLGGILAARPNTPAPPVPFNNLPWWPFGPTAPAGPQAASLDTIRPAMDATGNLTGEDILLTNVLSFEVKLSWDSNTTPQGILCGISTPPPGQHPTVVSGPNTVSLNNPEAIFDDLPIPSAVDGNDGNPLFARMTLNAPSMSFPFLNAANSSTFRTFVPGATRRVFDTWARIENPLPASNLAANWNNPSLLGPNGAAILSSFAAVPPRLNGSRRPYVDVIQGLPNNPALLNLGRWDERFIPFDATGAALANNPTQPTALIPNPNFVPLAIRPKAIQIKIRVWDTKNNVARQITIIEDL